MRANLSHVLQHLRKVADTQTARDLTDGELLERFQTTHEETAFALLVQRHGPMVLGVCRRILDNAADAEDAFQATFVVLVRRAASLASRAVLGDWLHGVARRTALKVRTDAARRRAKEQSVARAEATPEPPRKSFRDPREAVGASIRCLRAISPSEAPVSSRAAFRKQNCCAVNPSARACCCTASLTLRCATPMSRPTYSCSRNICRGN